MNLKALIEYYIPADTVSDKKKVMFETLLALLLRPELDPSTRIPIVDNLFGFVSHPDHISIVLNWLDKGAITGDNGEEVFKLGTRHKQSIVRIVFGDSGFDLQFKQQLLDKTLGEDKSDIAV